MAVKALSPIDTDRAFQKRVRSPLVIVLLLSQGVVASPEAQEETILPDVLACPVTANLFPEQIRRIDFIRFIFSGESFPRRISIALIHPQKKNMSIEYKWVGHITTRTGIFVVNAEGKTDCFFFRYQGISEDDHCREFVLFIPETITVKEITFSDQESEEPTVLCPMPVLEDEINKAYAACGLDPKDEGKASLLIQLLERTIPKFDCRQTLDDHRQVPAWWLASPVTLSNLSRLRDHVPQTLDSLSNKSLQIRLIALPSGPT